jgi:hypothetical protein
MYVCKMMRLSLPHVLILYIYYMYNVYLSLCVITLYCKCVSANKILLYYILYIIKNYDVFYPLIIPPRVLYWTICLKPVITVYLHLDGLTCHVLIVNKGVVWIIQFDWLNSRIYRQCQCLHISNAFPFPIDTKIINLFQ